MLAFHLLRRGLALHPRDYGFFVAQYHHLLDVPAFGRVPVNPNGNDAFGFHGIDGYPTVHDELHASPIKYLVALVYRATGSVYALQALWVAAYVVALLYVTRRMLDPLRPPLLRLSLLGLFALSPAFLFATTFDLRPYVLLGPFVAALAAALASRAPPRHLAVIATSGLAAREDAALVLALACVFLALDQRPSEARRLYAVVLVYVVGFFAVFFLASPFAHAWSLESVGAVVVLALFPCGLALPPRVSAFVLARFERHRALGLLVLGLPFYAMAARQLLTLGWPRHLFVWSARWYAPVAVLVVALASWLGTSASERVRLVAARAAGVLLVLAVAASARQLRVWYATEQARADFWPVAESIPLGTPIVTDYAHYQAFADRDEVVVWDRFPAYLEPSPGRDHPGSHAQLRAAALAPDALLVMSHRTYADVLDVMRGSGEPVPWVRCDEGTRWLVLRTEGGPTPCPTARE
jgi:hypothetical protein